MRWGLTEMPPRQSGQNLWFNQNLPHLRGGVFDPPSFRKVPLKSRSFWHVPFKVNSWNTRALLNKDSK
eukprot:7652875-Karenia_brevis.AAC.1